MCFRLLAALRAPPSAEVGWTREELERRGAAVGLDVRAATRGPTEFVELAWGDCACSLYTRKEGGRRVAAFVEDALTRGLRVQLLLGEDDGDWSTDETTEQVSFSALRDEGLAALPSGRVCEVVPA